MADPVVHFELPADDLERAQRFYRDVFGWTTTASPTMQYVLLGTTSIDPKTQRPAQPGAINGGMAQREGPIRAPVVTIAVPDIDLAAKKITKAGGRIVHPKMAVGRMGFSAYFTDPEGNIVGLFQPTLDG